MTNIIIIVVICIICLSLLIRRYRRFSPSNSYSWLEILNPFNSAPLQIYKHLSPENKGAFWSVCASVIIGVISCWLGFSVQFFVYNSTQAESDKLAHYEVVDKFRPLYYEIYDSCSTTVFEKMTLALAYLSEDNDKLTTDDYTYYYKHKEFPKEKQKLSEAILGSYVLNSKNWNSIIYAANKVIEVSSEIAPYLDPKNNSKLLNNNAIIVASTQIFEMVNDSVEHDSATIVDTCIKQQVKASIKGKVTIQNNLAKICPMQYSAYKQIKDSNPTSTEMALSMWINQGILQTMLGNVLIIQSCFNPSDKNIPLWTISLLILALSFCIGYFTMRIIVMKFFNINSMKPNPQMSQSDYEKIVRKINTAEKENNQHKVNDVTLLNSIDSCKKELKEKEAIIDKLEAELSNEKNIYQKQSSELNRKLNTLQSENEQLRKQIEDISESDHNNENKEE